MTDDRFDLQRQQVADFVAAHAKAAEQAGRSPIPTPLDPGTAREQWGYSCLAAEELHKANPSLPREHVERIVNDVRDQRAAKH